MYGQLPVVLGQFPVELDEMLFYQYLPIKIIGQTEPIMEQRLNPFSPLIGMILCDFVGAFGLDRYINSYVYVTAKKMINQQGCSFNRPGWHSDGFMTDDINYVWSDCYGTVFNKSSFSLTMDDSGSLVEMEQQADSENDIIYPDGSLIRLDQYNIHRVADLDETIMRTFLKVSFSKDKYDLNGNAHNYLLDYNWKMRDRKIQRNIQQNI
mgnify:CR=1 FL=1